MKLKKGNSISTCLVEDINEPTQIQHDLGTTNLIVQAYENNEQVGVGIKIIDENTIKVDFTGNISLKIVILGLPLQ